jgi:hypothetical protein
MIRNLIIKKFDSNRPVEQWWQLNNSGVIQKYDTTGPIESEPLGMEGGYVLT